MAADVVFATLSAWIERLESWCSQPALPGQTIIVHAYTEQDRVSTLCDLGLASAHDGQFDDISRNVAQAFDVPIALVSLADEVHHARHDTAAASTLNPNAAQQSAHESLDAHVIASGEVLVAEDVTADERFTHDPLVLEKGIRFYAGAPLRTSSGVIIGALCVIDTKPREFAEADQRKLQKMGDDLMAEFEKTRDEQRTG
jgi:GAF domain-containing protein